jgi:hypothetical protein
MEKILPVGEKRFTYMFLFSPECKIYANLGSWGEKIYMVVGGKNYAYPLRRNKT